VEDSLAVGGLSPSCNQRGISDAPRVRRTTQSPTKITVYIYVVDLTARIVENRSFDKKETGITCVFRARRLTGTE